MKDRHLLVFYAVSRSIGCVFEGKHLKRQSYIKLKESFLQKKVNEENLRKQEESVRRQEELRKSKCHFLMLKRASG